MISIRYNIIVIDTINTMTPANKPFIYAVRVPKDIELRLTTRK